MGHPSISSQGRGCAGLLTCRFILSLTLGSSLLCAQNSNYQEGLENFRNRQYFAAMLAAKKAVEEDRNNASYLHLYGLALAALEQFTEAEESLRKAISLSPERADFPYDLAVILLQRGKEKEALPLLQKSLELEGSNLMARLYLGRVYHNLNLSDLALEQFQYILKADPRFPWAHYHVAKIHLNLGQVQDAIRMLSREVQLHPEIAPARLELAELLIKEGEAEAAIEHLKQVETQMPESFEVHYALAKGFRLRGDLAQAISAAEKSIRVDTNRSEGHYLLAQLYLSAGRKEEANKELSLFRKLKQREKP